MLEPELEHPELLCGLTENTSLPADLLDPTCTPRLPDDLAVSAPPAQKAYREIARHPNAGPRALVLHGSRRPPRPTRPCRAP
ncbi:hypothetical protein [Saccharothrix deserti]|uniref:hypothetical protein n=1 Tax=Saccharothrix deserti TaxID=2593674 RepID=UPI00131D3856|nr:hypothetical protein [Saccharothrix deserti]